MRIEVELARQLVVFLIEVVADESLESVNVRLRPDKQRGCVLFLGLAQNPSLVWHSSKVFKDITGLCPLLYRV